MIYHHPLAYLLGVEGLALLRAWAGEGEHDEPFVRRRIEAIHGLLDDSELAAVPGVSVGRDATSPAYATWAATYDDPDNGLFAMDEPIIDDILEQLPVGDALDAACGTGRLAARLASRGFRVTGIDSSVEMLEVARTRVPGASFSEGDLASLPLPDDAVDLVTTGLALTHAPDLRLAYAEFARVLRPGGSLIVSDVHPDLVLLGSTVKAIAARRWRLAGDDSSAQPRRSPARRSRRAFHGAALRGTPTTCTDDDGPVAPADPRDRRMVDLAVDLAGLGPGGRPQRLEQPGDHRVALRTA